jgi:hypothetical protein
MRDSILVYIALVVSIIFLEQCDLSKKLDKISKLSESLYYTNLINNQEAPCKILKEKPGSRTSRTGQPSERTLKPN